MSAVVSMEAAVEAAELIVQRAEQRYEAHRREIFAYTDRLFSWLLIGQWIFAIGLAVFVTPYTWSGSRSSINVHVFAAAGLGGMLTLFPVYLVRTRPGDAVTRHSIAVAQMLWSALLIHLTGGRIETHFHIFGSLAFLGFYRDWKVIVTGAATVALDHFARGLFLPESVYGISNPEWWRFLEHAAWVVFCVVFLIIAARKSQQDMRAVAEKGAELEALSENAWRTSSVVQRAADEAKGA